MTATDSSSRPLHPKRLGERYVVRRLIGQGSCADVYECVQADNQRVVAVKVLSREMARSQRWLSRFRREVALTCNLSHANICRVFDSGTLDDGRPFYAMELLRGEPLSALLERRKTLSASDAVDVAIQVAAGLRVAHQTGVAHRDIKPGNLFLHRRAEGRVAVKILDFGLCKYIAEQDGVLGHGTKLTLQGTFVGTPFYFAPEHFNGSEADERVDLWALGVVLYEVLAGVRPFTAANLADLLLKIAHEPHPGLDGIRPGLDPGLVRVVDKSLCKDINARYRDAGALLSDLLALRSRLRSEAPG